MRSTSVNQSKAPTMILTFAFDSLMPLHNALHSNSLSWRKKKRDFVKLSWKSVRTMGLAVVCYIHVVAYLRTGRKNTYTKENMKHSNKIEKIVERKITAPHFNFWPKQNLEHTHISAITSLLSLRGNVEARINFNIPFLRTISLHFTHVHGDLHEVIKNLFNVSLLIQCLIDLNLIEVVWSRIKLLIFFRRRTYGPFCPQNCQWL